MARNAYERWKKLSVAAVAAAAMLLVAPAGAWAGSAYDGGRHHGRHADASRHHYYSHGNQHRHHRNHRGHAYGHAKHRHHTSYFCQPCNRYFDARRGLYDHVAYRHHVPFWQLANAITYNTLSWIFYG